MASSAFSRRSAAGSTRSRKSMRSPAPPSAGRRARRSGPSTSPASTSSCHVANDLAARLPQGRAARSSRFRRSSQEMVARGWIGEKAGRGFYERRRTDSGETEIWTLDPQKMEYRPRQPAKLAVARGAARMTLPASACGSCFRNDRGRRVSSRDAAADVALHGRDRARDRPFDRRRRSRDAWGYRLAARSVRAARDRRQCGARRERRADAAPAGRPRGPTGSRRDPAARSAAIARHAIRGSSNAGASLDRSRRRRARVSAALEDERDRRRCASTCCKRGVREAPSNFAALVVGDEGPNFSVGANLMLLLLEAQEGNWDEIDTMIRSFQRSTAGAALFGGARGRRAIRADAWRRLRDRAARRSRAGGRRELHGPGRGRRRTDPGRRRNQGNAALRRLAPEKAFETIGFAKTSTSAPDARRLGYLRDVDGWTMNRDRVVFDAKQLALKRAQDGYRPPVRPRRDSGRRRRRSGDARSGRASRVARRPHLRSRRADRPQAVTILAGGSLPHAGTVSEDQIAGPRA